MLTADMKFIGADIDPNLTYMERIETYEEEWNAIMAGHMGNVSPTDLCEVFERENAKGFTPKARFSEEPFLKIGRLMDKHELTTAEVREFLKWRAKDQNLTKARKTKTDKFLERRKAEPKTVFNSLD